MQDSTQCAAIELFMVGDYQLGKGQVAPQDDGATVLAFLVKTRFDECFHTVST